MVRHKAWCADVVDAGGCRRTDNLGARAQAKLARRKDKREKKLMRAGFEGRRDTFINA